MHSGGTQLVYTVHQTLPSLAEVGLACEIRFEASASGVRLCNIIVHM